MDDMHKYVQKTIYDVTITEKGKFAVIARVVTMKIMDPIDVLVLPYDFEELSEAESAAETLNRNDVSLHHAGYILDDMFSESVREKAVIR